MFSEKQTQALSYEIDKNRIKTRTKGSINLSYLEGYDVIDTANRIFGFGNWSYGVTTLKHITTEINKNQNHVIGYKAIVKVLVYDKTHTKHISREDVGFGCGIAKSLSDAHENAAKEAVTDAIKRAMRSFGNQFGNSLYNKEKLTPTISNRGQGRRLPQHNQAYPTNTPKSNQYANSYEFQSLTNLGLKIVEQGDNLIVVGNDIFSKKDSIKACGFRWDSVNKQWYMPRKYVA